MALSFHSEIDCVWHDTKVVLRPILNLFNSLKDYRIAGLPADRLIHFALAAALFLIAVRLMARWKAALVTLAAILLKEIVDVPLKLGLLRPAEPMVITIDTVWDVAAGALGLGAAVLLAAMLGSRWRARPPKTRAAPLPELRPAELPPIVRGVMFGAILAISAAVFVGFELAGFVSGRGYLSLLPHVIGAAAVVACCAFFGTAHTLLVLIPVLPFAKWIQVHTADDALSLVNTLILALACCDVVRRLKSKRRRLFFQRADWLVVIYAAYACAIVMLNCFRLGWTLSRTYWLVPPVVGLAVYFLARDLLCDLRLIRRALVLLGVVFLLLASAGVVEFGVRPFRPEVVPGSVFGSAPVFSVYLSLIWPFLLSLCLSGGARPRLLFCLCAAVGLATIGLVCVRACWVASACALALLLVIFLLRRDWVLCVASVAGIAFAVAMLTWSIRQAEAKGGEQGPFKSHFVREAVSAFDPRSYQKARARTLYRSGKIITASPFLGQTGKTPHTLHHAHAINYGIPGTALAVVAVLGILACGWAGAMRTREPLVFGVAVGATAGVLAAILQGMAWPTLAGSSMQPFLWYTLGLVSASVCAVRRGRAEGTARRKENRGERLPGRSDPSAGHERVVLLAIALVSFAAVGVLFWLTFR